MWFAVELSGGWPYTNATKLPTSDLWLKLSLRVIFQQLIQADWLIFNLPRLVTSTAHVFLGDIPPTPLLSAVSAPVFIYVLDHSLSYRMVLKLIQAKLTLLELPYKVILRKHFHHRP